MERGDGRAPAERSSLRASLLRESFQRALDPIQSSLQLTRGERTVRRARRQAWIAPPPVQSDLLGFVDRANKKPYLNREELDVRKVDLYVAGNDQSLVEDAVENVDQSVRSRRGN